MKPPDPTPGVMSGVSDPAIQAGSYAVTLTRLAPGLRLPRHAHEKGTLNVVLDGHFGEAVGRCRMETHGPATAILKPAGAVHENVVGKSLVECLVVDFRGSDPRAVMMRRSAEVARVGGRLRVELARHPDVSSLVIEELVVLLVAESTATPSPVRCVGDRWLEQARELLHEEPGPQSLGELGRRVDRHPVYVARAFRARFGCSVGEYARHLRLERARRLLHDRRVTLLEAADRAGYSDQSHMTRDFQRQYRTSPGVYRKRVRQG